MKHPRRLVEAHGRFNVPRAAFTAPSTDCVRRRIINSNGTEDPPLPQRLGCNGRPGTKRSVRPPPRRKHRLKLAKAKRRPHAAIRTSGNGRPHRLSASGLSSIIREPRRWWITIHRYWVLLKNSRFWGVFRVMGVTRQTPKAPRMRSAVDAVCRLESFNAELSSGSARQGLLSRRFLCPRRLLGAWLIIVAGCIVKLRSPL